MKEVSPGIFEPESSEEQALLLADPPPEWILEKVKEAEEASDFPPAESS